jgi:cell division protein FtsA
VVRNPIHATGVGLLLFGNKQLAEGQLESRSTDGMKGMFSRMKSWFQGNF